MEELHDDVIGSTTVETIRKIKSKRSGLIQGGTPNESTQSFSNGDSTPETMITTSKTTQQTIQMKKARTSNDIDEINNLGKSNKVGIREKENAFARLSKGKSLSIPPGSLRKKQEAPKAQVNFFDNAYKPMILTLIDTILSKGKEISTLMEEKSISRGYINKFIVDDQHFSTCLSGLLDRMFKAGEITGDLKNLNKQNFGKLEAFVKAKIEARVRLEQIEADIEDHHKKADFMAKKRINDLHRQLQGN